MRFFLAVATLLFYSFISCNTFFGEFDSPKKHCNAKALRKDIQQNWKYDSEKKYYMTNDSFISKLNSVYYDCLYGADTSTIIKYFGKNFLMSSEIYPRKEGADNHETPMLQYSITPPCNYSKPSGSCSFLFILVDSNYKVIQIKKNKESFESKQ